MFHSNTNGEGFDTDDSSLAAGLLTTAAILSDDPGHQSLQGITAYITACKAASRFIGLLNNSFSSRSSRDQETLPYIVTTKSPVDQGLGSSLSTQSEYVTIDMPSQNEEQTQLQNEGLVLTMANTTITAILSDNPGCRWRRGITACQFICLSIKKTGYYYCEDQLESSTSPLINNEIQTNSSKQEASDLEDGLLNSASRTYNRFSSKSSRDEETSSQSNPVDQGLGSSLSTQSADIPSSIVQQRNKVAQIVKKRDLISLKDDFGDVKEVASIFDSDLESGIRSSIQEPETELAELLSSAVQDPIEKTLLEDQIEKINTYVENLSLSVSILIASVAFIRLLCSRHVGVDNEFPELKGNVSVDMLMKIFEKIVLKPQGKVSILASALTVVVIAIQHGMPFVITISLSCWNSKMVKNQAGPQNLSACATMGFVSVICIDATGGLVCNNLEVSHFYIGGKDLKDDTDSKIDPAVTNSLEQVMRGIRASHLAPAISAIPAYDSLISWANSRWAALPCGIHFAVEFISYFLLNWSLGSNGSQTLLSRRRPQPYLLGIGIPFSVFIFFTVSYNYNPNVGKTLR
ncbi:hypothetical protein EZV62_020766 [Acer yangbiense]|uniref:Uncharacterized protein n=1 Tax=Acer yangbiense TaxID=1000413 RepID=A0A5C7HER3_9ROSI|nr:hypothetical protein EZV62_020766 [Acer yangbiense]